MIRLDTSPLAFFVSAGREFGLGHWRRMQAVAKAYQTQGYHGPFDFYVLGGNSHDCVALDNTINKSTLYYAHDFNLTAFFSEQFYSTIFFDLHEFHCSSDIFALSKYFQNRDGFVVAIDHGAIHADMTADLRWVPSFFINPEWPSDLDIQCGWGHYLLEKKFETLPAPQLNRLLVLTGGSDAAGLGAIWPKMIDEVIKQELEVNWVQGPFSPSPIFPEKPRHTFIIHHAPNGLDQLINRCDWVLTVHGVSVFEALMYERTCIVYNPYASQNDQEMTALENEKIVFLARSIEETGNFLQKSVAGKNGFFASSAHKLKLLDGRGGNRLIGEVEKLRQIKNTTTD